MATFIDLLNALVPTPGVFAEGGHDYRRRSRRRCGRCGWRRRGADGAGSSRRCGAELGWEVKRRWMEAEAMPTPRRVKAERALAADVSRWTGRDVDLDGIRRIIDG